MKTEILATVLVTAFVSAVQAGGPYYLTSAASDQAAVAFESAQYWEDANGATYDGGTVFDASADYIVAGNRVLRSRGGWQNVPAVEFGGRTLTLGSIANAKNGYFSLAESGAAFKIDLKSMILEKGEIRHIYIANAKNTLDGDMLVRSPATAPFGFYGWYDGLELTLTGDVTSSADTVGILLGGRHGNGLVVKSTGSWSGYEGEVRLRKSNNAPLAEDDTRLVAGSSMSFPGKLALEDATTLVLGNAFDDFTVDALELGAGSKLRLTVDGSGSSSVIEVDEAISATYPVKVDLDISAFTDHSLGMLTTIMMLPENSGIDGTEFVLSDALTALGAKLAFNGVSNTITVSIPSTVTQTVSDGTSSAGHQHIQASSLLDAGHWSDDRLPHDNADYFVQPINNVACHLHTPVDADYVFPGNSLTFKAWCNFYCSASSFDCPRLVVNNHCLVYMCNNEGYTPATTFKGGIVDFPSGSVRIGSWANTIGRPVVFESELTGEAELLLGSVDSTSYAYGVTYFKANNDRFLGKITLNLQNAPNVIPSASMCQTLLVNNGRNVGGALAAMDYEALKLSQWSRLAVISNATAVTFEDGVNRGIYVSGNGQMRADEGQTLTIRRPLTVDGMLYKDGDGVLELASAVRLGTDVNSLSVGEGAVKVSNAEAVNGLAVTVADVAALRLDPAAIATSVYGIRNEKASVPFADGGSDGKITVELEAANAAALRGRVIPLVTVAASQANAVKAMLSPALVGAGALPKYRLVTENVNLGDVPSTIIKADFTASPLVLFVR